MNMFFLLINFSSITVYIKAVDGMKKCDLIVVELTCCRRLYTYLHYYVD